jgi:hypothetical protein
MKFCKLTVAVACLFGNMSYNLDTKIENTILAQTQSSAFASQESGWSLTMNAAQAIETISVVGQRPPSGGSYWGGGGGYWDQTDSRDDDGGGGSGGGNTNSNNGAEEKTPREECQELNAGILASCLVQSASTYVRDLEDLCFGQGTGGVSGGLPFFQADFSIDAYGFCKDYSEAMRDVGNAVCVSNNAELTKLCPAG